MDFLRFFAKIQFSENYNFGYKKAQKIKYFFSERKSMDHKLSKNVFGMFIRFLVQTLCKFEKS